MEKQIMLPRDLQRYRRLKYCIRALGFVGWIAVWLLSALSYNSSHRTYPPERLMVGWKLVLLAVGAIVTGVFLFRLTRLMTLSKTVQGTVIKSATFRVYAPSDDPKRILQYDFRTMKKLTIQSADRRKHRLMFEEKDGFYNYYSEGTQVCRIAGFPYPIAMKGENVLCICCGHLNPIGNTVCDLCDHGLVE